MALAVNYSSRVLAIITGLPAFKASKPPMPTKQKRIYLMLLSIFLGAAFSFVYVGVQYGNGLAYGVSYWALILLSFPSFLLWQGYGLEALSNFGTGFMIFAIILQSIWLYLIACSLSLFIKWKKVEH